MAHISSDGNMYKKKCILISSFSYQNRTSSSVIFLTLFTNARLYPNSNPFWTSITKQRNVSHLFYKHGNFN